MKTIAFHTLGCKMNFAETSALSREVNLRGFEGVAFSSKADIYVVHSCMVTGAAERKVIAAIRQARKRNTEARIIVIGCMPELNSERLLQEEGVSMVLGNKDKYRLPDILANESEISVSQAEEIFVPSWSGGDRTRTFFKVQDGCDYFCSYCTIPLARGRSRSNTIAQTIETAREIIQSGAQEIVLTGINLGDFGRKNNEDFLSLLQALEELDGLNRIRLSSVEPDLMNDAIIHLVARSEKLLPHFHIPLQSGSARILNLMKRRYTKELFADRVRAIKELMPHACIATDIIAGFPGETEDDFNEELEFIRMNAISYMHVFTYSKRSNTRASDLGEEINGRIKKERSHILHELSEQKKQYFYLENKGRICDALIESDRHHGFLYGFTDNYIKVRLPFKPEIINTIVRVKLHEPADDGSFDVVIR